MLKITLFNLIKSKTKSPLSKISLIIFLNILLKEKPKNNFSTLSLKNPKLPNEKFYLIFKKINISFFIKIFNKAFIFFLSFISFFFLKKKKV
jgi:hypothetical protein